jgi:hypothetical protein
MKNIGQICAFILYLVVVCLVIYGVYWIAKTCSYSIFYEDMVIQTIKEVVKPEYLLVK